MWPPLCLPEGAFAAAVFGPGSLSRGAEGECLRPSTCHSQSFSSVSSQVSSVRPAAAFPKFQSLDSLNARFTETSGGS